MVIGLGAALAATLALAPGGGAADVGGTDVPPPQAAAMIADSAMHVSAFMSRLPCSFAYSSMRGLCS
jgi:hypothetical protein